MFKRLMQSVDRMMGRGVIDEQLYDELEEALLQADTNVQTAHEILDELRQAVRDEKVTEPEGIKATKKLDRIPNIWRALAAHPEHLELCWTRLKAIMQPGKVDMLTKEIIALAVSVTNSCHY